MTKLTKAQTRVLSNLQTKPAVIDGLTLVTWTTATLLETTDKLCYSLCQLGLARRQWDDDGFWRYTGVVK